MNRRRVFAVIAVPSLLLLTASAARAAQAPPTHTAAKPVKTHSTATGGAFTTGVLPPPPAGSTSTWNQASEPQIRSDQAGNFYISSENGLGAGTDAWKSANGGTSYSSLPQPNALSQASGSTGVAPGGGDTDLATAPSPNASGTDNVYVASLSLADVTVSASTDGGRTWTSQPVAATAPGDDREWIAAFGQNGYDLSYHAESGGSQIVVNEGQLSNGTPTTLQTYNAINPGQPNIYLATIEANEIGNIAVDPTSGDVYQIFVGCPPGDYTQPVDCANYSAAYMAVGVPTGTDPSGEPIYTFTDYVIYNGPTTAGLDNNFPVVAVDKAGNVYAAWSDDHRVFVSYSTDKGQTWSAPKPANSGSATTAIFPWLAAGANGEVDLVYYATPDAQNYQTCATSSSSDPCQTEPWYVYFAQNTATTSGGGWSQQQVTSKAVHFGGVCQGGISCTSTGNDNRDLYDDFGVAASPTSGLASITYSDDQYADNTGTANSGECTSSQDNTVSCDHTDFATQTSGTGIG